jgi:hypothetical protein
MTAIDCTDCYLAIQIGDGVRRALVRHFRHFITDRLEAHGIATRDERRRDQVDRDAWRLAATVLSEAENELLGTLDESLLNDDPQKGAQGILAAVVGASVAGIEQDYLADALCGFEVLAAKIGQSLA